MNTSHQNALQRGWQFHQQKHFAHAERIYRAVLQEDSQNANAWCYLGIALHDQRDYPAAVAAYRQALQLHPEFPIALNNLGNSLRYVGEFEESDRSFQHAIDLKPDYFNAYKNRGTLHVWTGQLDKGLLYYQQALELNPNDAELHRNLGVIYLLQGRFAEGWAEYRWRWKVGDLHRPQIAAPVWNGQDLRGKSILLTAEQGLGDTLHFVRMANLLRQHGAQTLIYCQAPLVALLQQSAELGPVFPNSLQPEGRFDFQCSLLDVADVLQIRADNVPATLPYLHASEHLRSYWAGRLPRSPGKFRIGIAWQGNPDHQADLFRSVPLKEFECLSQIPEVELVSFQTGQGTEQLQQWQGSSAVLSLGPQIDQTGGAFMDTAAIMETLDLVISSDTSIAHLAGGLNVPTWIALGFVPDWRWMLAREDSPWYPSIRLFRQAKIGDWQTVFERMASEVKRIVVSRGT
ncbi:tetratricopeptide repeat protein [Aureliella helgolandensis]|uniref:Photosystem I assembly protein Ycf3 n=1 Tax=Aureliella helgolandensis TaxID=2527968 RepID=A0A518GFP9_9BACT|nr:tetratricopeptide repeat-containing glycosyltransferase family protein [Aureliella helgolandensis]QDV27414.1 photosystem I assembly protein Ycf3 [Aureliella helgolandensis]